MCAKCVATPRVSRWPSVPKGGPLDQPLILAALYLSEELQDIHLLCLMCGQGADVD